MKRPPLMASIELLIFFVLLAGGFIFLGPVSRRLENALVSLEHGLLLQVEELTGLSVSYESLSPSVFRSIRLTGLKLSDSSNGSEVARIEHFSLTYRFIPILKGDFAGALDQIIIENGTVAIDGDLNAGVLEHLRKMGGEKRSEGGFALSRGDNAPLSVRIRNVDLQYSDSLQSLQARIGRGNAEITSSGMKFSLEGRTRYRRPSISWLETVSAQVAFRGTVGEKLDSGSASLLIQSLETGDFTISKIALVTSFRDGILTAGSVQDLQPVDLRFELNTADGELSASLECDRLLPFRWIRFRKQESPLTGLSDALLSGTASVHVSGTGELGYRAKLDAGIPDSFFGGGNVSLDLEGDESRVSIRNASVKGARYDLSYAGSLDIARLIPDGRLAVRRLILPSGTSITADVAVNGGKNSFTCLIPSLAVNQASISGIQATVKPQKGSIEFSLTADDRSGRITTEGTWTTGTASFLQIYAAFDSISVANGAALALSLLSPGSAMTKPDFLAKLDPYALTTEFYFSTDFEQVSFNCTRLVLASGEKDGLFVLFSAKGNELGIDITDIAFSRGGYTITGDIFTGFESSGDLLFESSLLVNSLPYRFSGMYGNHSLSLYGDYDLALSVLFDDLGTITGSLHTGDLPLPVGKYLFSLGVSAEFVYSPRTSWEISLSEGTLEELSGKLPLSTRVRFGGTVDPAGVFLETLSVSDEASTVSGYAGIRLAEDGSAAGTSPLSDFMIEAELRSAENSEAYRVTGQITKSGELFFQTEIEVSDCPVMRFVRNQKTSDTLSCAISASGTPSDIFASADIRALRYRLGGFDLDAHGTVLLEDRVVSIHDAGLSWNGKNCTDLAGSVSLDDLGASLTTDFSTTIGKSGLSAKLSLSFETSALPAASDSGDTAGLAAADGNTAAADTAGEGNLKGLPLMAGRLGRFTVQAGISDIRWKTLSHPEPVIATFVHEPGITALYAGDNDALTGYLIDDGTFFLQSQSPSPVAFHADGKVVNGNLSIIVGDFHTDLSSFWPYTGIDLVQFSEGAVDGEFGITGLLSDPDFRGSLRASGIAATAPDLLVEPWNVAGFDILAEGKTVTIPTFVASSRDGSFNADADFEFDRWIPSRINVRAKTQSGRFIRLNTRNSLFKADGYATCDMELSLAQDVLEITGKAGFERGAFAILLGQSKQVASDSRNSLDYRVDLELSAGRKVEFRWPTDDIPIIRGLIQADDPFQVSLDTVKRSFSLKGSAKLKGGEIFYIKRSFYLRQGQITFNENQDRFDPLIDLRAEIRERDAEGEPVRIILTVANQPLSSFTPVLTSDPPKGDTEIMVLLGAAASADSSRETLLKDTVITASDIFTQMSLFRNAENGIRDSLNLDIFSVRTLILQNAILGQAMQSDSDAPMTIGNYFDNTTVYMGKYLGSAIYADALMHFSYYDPKSAENTGNPQGVYGSMLFQPELGLEVTTPFFLLRWGITPSSPETLFIADNSVTLSWKFSY